MYCVGGFLPFSEIFPLPCHNVGEIPTVFLRKKSQIFSARPVPLLPQAQWLVAVKTPLLFFLLFISAICLQTAYSLRQGLGLITFVHLSPSCARTRASYKCIQYSTIRAEPKNSTGSWGSRTSVKVCGGTITFKGLTVSRQVFVHNPMQQSFMRGGERMVGIERKSQLSFGCRQGFMEVVTPGSAKGLRVSWLLRRAFSRQKDTLNKNLGKQKTLGGSAQTFESIIFNLGYFNWNYF